MKASSMSRAKPPRAPSSDRSSATASAPVPGDARNLDAFVDAAQRAPVPATHTTHRLIFAMDATASRQPTWDMACNLHTALFNEADRLGNVAIQLCFYRGYNELRASRWATTPATGSGRRTASWSP